MRCLQLYYGLLIFLQEQRIEKQIQRMQPELDLLIVLFLHWFFLLESMLGPKWCLTTKLQEYLQRLHAEPNQVFKEFYLIRPKENCMDMKENYKFANWAMNETDKMNLHKLADRSERFMYIFNAKE